MHTATQGRGKLLVTVCLALGASGPLGARAASNATAWTGPRLASPGGLGREGHVGTGCPTFSWALVPAAREYELAVFPVGRAGDPQLAEEEPLLRMALPAGVTSWTPDLQDCLPAGRYGWAVAAIVPTEGAPEGRHWSRPALFQVEGAVPNRREPAPADRSNRPNRPVEDGLVVPSPAPGGDSPPRPLTDAALYSPEDCSAGGETFADVPASDPFCRWIEQLARDGITAGCGAGNYCPDQPVTRRQIAFLLERAMRGTLQFAPTLRRPNLETVENVANNVGLYTSIAIGADDLPIVSYQDATAGTLKVAHCQDIACNKQKTINTVDATGNTVGAYSSIAIGNDGLPIISYYDADAQALKVAHCNDILCAGGNETLTTIDDPANDVGQFSSIAIGADHLPIISYADVDANSLKVAHCNDALCAGNNETITTVDDPADIVGRYTSIAIGSDNLPIISYEDVSGNALRVAHCNDILCAGNNETITNVDDPSNSVGENTSIAIGVDGLPIISYRDGTAFDLKVAHCNDVLCAGHDETITTVDGSPSGDGDHTSIAIGADGLPVISYRDGSAGALMVAHCNDVSCAGGDETITAVDDGADTVGAFTSIVIGVDGAPVISYYDTTDQSLKIAHCYTVSCTQ